MECGEGPAGQKHGRGVDSTVKAWWGNGLAACWPTNFPERQLACFTAAQSFLACAAALQGERDPEPVIAREAYILWCGRRTVAGPEG